MKTLKNIGIFLGCACLLMGAAFADEVKTVALPAPSASADIGDTGHLLPPVPADGILDDGMAGWVWSDMTEYDDPGLHGGTARCGGDGSYGAYTFKGTGVQVIGVPMPVVIDANHRGHKTGKAKISLDGKDMASVDMFSPDLTYDFVIYEKRDLPDGIHVLQIQADKGWIVIDYIKVIVSSRDAQAIAARNAKDTDPNAPVKDGYYRVYPVANPSLFLDLNTDPMDAGKIVAAPWRDGNTQLWKVLHVAGTMNTYAFESAAKPGQYITDSFGQCGCPGPHPALASYNESTGNTASGNDKKISVRRQEFDLVPVKKSGSDKPGDFYYYLKNRAEVPAVPELYGVDLYLDAIDCDKASGYTDPWVCNWKFSGKMSQQWGFQFVAPL